jgi:predicted ribosomally synthesized peptide with SipW-like signal peptide
MSKKRFKQYLMLLTVVGLVAVAAGGSGTFASFNAEVVNPGNTFATGTLLLSDTVQTGTTCYSNEAAGNLNSNCDVLLNTGNLKTGTSESNYLTIKNEGTLTGTDVKLFVPQDQTGSVSCLNTTTGTFPGTDALAHTGDVCGNMLISVEEDATAGGTATACVVGTEIGGGNHACDPTAGTSFATFYGAHNTATNGLGLTGSTLAPNATHYYTVYMYLPDENNTFQGRTATFDLSWHMDQS